MTKKRKCKNCGRSIEEGLRFFGGTRFCSIECFLAFKLPQRKETKTKQTGSSHRYQAKKSKVKLNPRRKVRLEKLKRDVDPEYRKFVSSFGCMVCGRPSVAHHTETGGMGIKGSDYSCINLCNDHHTLGTKAIHKIGPIIFEQEHNVDIKKQQIELLRQYIRLISDPSLQTKAR